MADPLSDPRAQHLLSADTGEIASLAAAFHQVAHQAQTAATGLRGAQNDATWTGAAADAFRGQVGKLPGDLDKVQHSYGEVATALDGYASGLAPIQSQFRSLATQLHDAQSSLSTAQGQQARAKTDLSTATAAPHVTSTTPAVLNAHNALETANGAVGHLQDQLSGLQSRGVRLLDEFDTIRGHARSTVSSAAGIAPSESWLSGALHAVGNFVENVGRGIGSSVWNLVSGKAIINFVEHPSWSTFGELAKDVAVTASLVAMVAAPFAAPELIEADAAAGGADAAAGAGAEGAAGAATSGASTFANGASALSDGAGQVSTVAGLGASSSDAAQGKWGDAAVDLAFTAGPNLGHMPTGAGDVKSFGDQFANALGIGDRTAEADAAAATGVRDYQGWTGIGLNPAAAKSLAFQDGVVPKALSGVDLDAPGTLSAAISQANKSAATALRLGRPAAIGFDNVVGDPSQEAIQQHLSPEPACG
jgi:X-X-X-Leu-X-X-Gly heptad repeat protein